MKKYFQVTKTDTVGVLKKKKERKKQLRLRRNHKTDDTPENENNFLHVNKRGF